MNLYYLISLISSLVFLSPLPSCYEEKTDLILVAQYSLYTDKEGSFLTWKTSLNRNFYDNDCEAMFDLFQFKNEICTPQEIEEMVIKLRGFSKDTINYNKL